MAYTHGTTDLPDPENVISGTDDSYSDLDCLSWTRSEIDTETTIYLYALIVLFFVSIIGNGSLILLFLRVKSLRRINNVFIINMAIGDILYTTVFIPIEIYKGFHHGLRPFGWFMCYFSISLNYTSQYVSIFSLMALSMLRFRPVVLPIQRPPPRRKCLLWLGCLAIWVVSFCLAASTTTQCYVLEYPDCESGRNVTEHRLKMTSDFFSYYIPFQFAILFVLPLVAISIMYGTMAYTLFRAQLPMGRSSINGVVSPSRRRPAITVLLLVIIFAVCWFPHHIRLLIVEFQSYEHQVLSNENELIFRKVQFFLTILSSVLNPFILYLTASTFRKNLVTFCPICKNKGMLRINTHMTTLRNTRRSITNQQRGSRCPPPAVTAM